MLGHTLQNFTAGFQEFNVTFLGCLSNERGYAVFIADEIMFGYQAAKALHFVGQHRISQHQFHVFFADENDLRWLQCLYIIYTGPAG